jgi:hypothetical protein
MKNEMETVWRGLEQSNWTSKPRWWHNLSMFGFTEDEMNEIWLQRDEEDMFISQLEDQWLLKKNETRILINEFKDQIPVKERNQMRIDYLQPRADQLEAELLIELRDYLKMFETNQPYWRRELKAERIEKQQNQTNKIKLEIRFLQNYEKLKDNQVTPEEIARAKEYPIENLISVNRMGFALCPFHGDKNPSLYTKNNFYHCFSCKEHGDVIDYVMKINNKTFMEAVKLLV